MHFQLNGLETSVNFFLSCHLDKKKLSDSAPFSVVQRLRVKAVCLLPNVSLLLPLHRGTRPSHRGSTFISSCYPYRYPNAKEAENLRRLNNQYRGISSIFWCTVTHKQVLQRKRILAIMQILSACLFSSS